MESVWGGECVCVRRPASGRVQCRPEEHHVQYVSEVVEVQPSDIHALVRTFDEGLMYSSTRSRRTCEEGA